ncbi:hypothetical protein Ddc_05180 [Ditylenchus destructor]|nr:hypothetical protein Ddc_05180 [Ditylenchus destructor]
MGARCSIYLEGLGGVCGGQSASDTRNDSNNNETPRPFSFRSILACEHPCSPKCGVVESMTTAYSHLFAV